MKVTITNKFHGTSMETSIKDEYCNDPSIDVLTSLDYAIYSDDSAYAKRKQKEIKNELCGCSGCKCSASYEVENA